MKETVNHPAHYADSKYEVITFIEDHGLGFHLGNAIKYISRAGKKNPDKTIEDLQKAIWYIKRASSVRANFVGAGERSINILDYCSDKKLPESLALAVVNILKREYDQAIDNINQRICQLSEEKEVCSYG